MVTALDILFNLWPHQYYFEIGMEINHLKYYADFKILPKSIEVNQ